ncbi:MAG: methionine--tRNA ligase [Myxococcota bacterium]
MARHLVTSALPYVNSVKHLGNVVGSLLPADVHARWLRNEGHQVLFVCGTDEHGAPAEIAAAAAGAPVGPWCDQLHAIQAEQYRRLNLSFDRFGRTSDPGTRAVATEVYLALRDAGLVDRRVVHQLYSPADGRFLPDRYVHGTCPHCASAGARGDQCDACGRLLDPEDLIAPRSALSGSTALERRATEHAYLRLSALAEWARGHLERHPEWSAITRSVARSWLDQGLEDRCITRDLAWGTPVPDLPGKVFWCWFDAPLGYVGLTREADPDGWRRWWDPDGDCRITQFLGKDNVPFHAIWLPAILHATGLRPPDRVHGLHWLLWEGDKFSTSAGRGVFLDEALERLPADVWRWVLLAQAPETADTWFGWDKVAAIADKDLAGQLGNLVHRVQRLASAVPAGGEAGADEDAVWAEARSHAAALAAAHESLGFRDVIGALRGLLHTVNRYVDRQAPWSRGPRQEVVLRTCFELLRLVATAVEPVIPETAVRIGAVLGVDAVAVPLASQLAPGGLAGRPLTPTGPLFPRERAG